MRTSVVNLSVLTLVVLFLLGCGSGNGSKPADDLTADDGYEQRDGADTVTPDVQPGDLDAKETQPEDLADLDAEHQAEVFETVDEELDGQDVSPEVDICDPCGPCDDDNLCTENDEWVDGVCVGTPISCDDGNECTSELCFPSQGCVSGPNSHSCDDGDPCTFPDYCSEGSCQGQAMPNCGNPVCGDAKCQGDETCANCPQDCSPLGSGLCGDPCDPTAVVPSCAGNFACLPTQDGAPFADPLHAGHGVCGMPCVGPADCPGGICVTISGFDAPGQCAAACNPADPQECVGQVACLPLADNPAQGACLGALACDPAVPDSCPCHEAPGVVAAGLCLTPCHIQDPEACWGGLQECLVRTDAKWHEGTCVGQTSPCDVATQAGCGQGQSCLPVAGPGISGSTLVCFDSPGLLSAGEPCLADPDGCGPGLLCAAGVCRAPCDPALPLCPGGVCQDAGAVLWLPEGSVGLCLPDCGDASCANGENCLSCPQDCGACVESCGDGICFGGEACENCPEDCPCPACGDGLCDGEEDCLSCPEDCSDCPVCPDGVCADGESCETCPADCGWCVGVCGDGQCSPLEFCFSCPADCGVCPDSCGDGECVGGETCAGCPEDCGPCPGACGDGACGPGETCVTCPADCTLLGLVCQDACDPTQGTGACAEGLACVPTHNDLLFLPPFELGNGVCGNGCTQDSDCGTGVCVTLGGLGTAGVCAAACSQDSQCAAGWSCVPRSADPEDGACFPGPSCSAMESCSFDPMTTCVPLAEGEGRGVCLPHCWAQAPTPCAVGTCIVRSDPIWHSGRCVGQIPSCEPVAQTGCQADQTCLVLGGSALGGQARYCGGPSGTGAVGSDCEPGDCLAGLTCLYGTCYAFCDPVASACAAGECFDIGVEFHLPGGVLGVCVVE